MSGSQFRKLRTAVGLSQEMLSKELNVTVRHIRRWENGQNPIPKIAELALKYIVKKHQEKERQ